MVLTQKEVNQDIAKLVKRKEGEQAATVKRAEKAAAKNVADNAKAVAEVEYQAACDAALAGGLPKPKRPRAPRKSKAVAEARTGGANKGGGSGNSKRKGQAITGIGIEAGNDLEELDDIEIEEQRRVLQIQVVFRGMCRPSIGWRLEGLGLFGY